MVINKILFSHPVSYCGMFFCIDCYYRQIRARPLWREGGGALTTTLRIFLNAFRAIADANLKSCIFVIHGFDTFCENAEMWWAVSESEAKSLCRYKRFFVEIKKRQTLRNSSEIRFPKMSYVLTCDTKKYKILRFKK